mgnify:CR=1 FL=1
MPHAHRAHPRGVALCLASAAGFGAMAIFAKEAYAGGATIPTLLAVRFTLASVVLWALLLPRLSRSPVTGRRPGGRPPSLLPGLALGVLYAVEASAWFIALSRIDAALAELLLYAYPALVVVGAALLGRERLTRGRVQALALSTIGIVLVLVAGVAERDPLLVSAQVVTGAALCFLVYGVGTGSIDLALSAEAWVATLSLAILSTVVPILAFLKGMQLVGVGTATILSTAEPVVTVGLALIVLGESLAPVQIVGGALVLAALALLARVPSAHEPARVAARPAPAREVRERAAAG